MCSEGGQDPQGQKAPNSWKTVVFSGILCHSEGDCLFQKPKAGPQNRHRLCLAARVSYDDLADRTALVGDELHKFLTYQLPTLGYWPTVGEIQKGTAGRGREKKCHDNLRQTSRQFMTCHDNLRHFMTISVSLFH